MVVLHKTTSVAGRHESPMTLAALAVRYGKPVIALRTIQKSLGLHVPTVDLSFIHHPFGSREKELFKGAEMGEDVRKLLADYLRLLAGIRQTVAVEMPVVRNAFCWAAKVFA